MWLFPYLLCETIAFVSINSRRGMYITTFLQLLVRLMWWWWYGYIRQFHWLSNWLWIYDDWTLSQRQDIELKRSGRRSGRRRRVRGGGRRGWGVGGGGGRRGAGSSRSTNLENTSIFKERLPIVLTRTCSYRRQFNNFFFLELI